MLSLFPSTRRAAQASARRPAIITAIVFGGLGSKLTSTNPNRLRSRIQVRPASGARPSDVVVASTSAGSRGCVAVPEANAAPKGEHGVLLATHAAGWLVVFLALASSARQTGQVTARTPFKCPAWDDAEKLTDVERYATKDDYVQACDDARYVLEKVRYQSDGLSLVAYFHHLRIPDGSKRPVIVFNRGSYVRNDIAPELIPIFHRLANAGFAVVAPMYRGSDGGEGRDEMGGADLNDLMNIVPVIRQLDALDVTNLFLYGESRGGMMVFQAIRDGFPARAAATLGAFTNLADLTSSEAGAATAKQIWPDFAKREQEIVARRSATQWPERLALPLLLMHGGADRDVAPAQTLRLAAQLAEHRREYGLSIFPGANHTLQHDRTEHDRQVTAFFRRYLAR